MTWEQESVPSFKFDSTADTSGNTYKITVASDGTVSLETNGAPAGSIKVGLGYQDVKDAFADIAAAL